MRRSGPWLGLVTLGVLLSACGSGDSSKPRADAGRDGPVPAAGAGGTLSMATLDAALMADAARDADNARVDASSELDATAANIDASISDASTAADGGASTTPALEGVVHLIKRMDSSFDPYVTSPSPTTISWLNDHLYRMEVFTTFFDAKTSFYPNGWVYWDSAAIYVGSDTANAHPDWILEDTSGKHVFVDWGCSNGSCPQYAADISNAAFRTWWIDSLAATLTKGYKGAWIDDVNLALRFSNGSKSVVARSPTTKTTMTEDVWSAQVAAFMAEARRALTGDELLHNSIWYARPQRSMDASVKAQILAADVINLEGGFASDQGLTGGTGDFSVSAKLAFADAVHALGRWVVVDDFPSNDTERQYALACYLLLSNGHDGLGDASVTPDKYWTGYDVQLGAALGARTRQANGVFRREFEHGVVLMLEPGAASTTVTLPTTYKTIDGNDVTQVMLTAKHGAVLLAK